MAPASTDTKRGLHGQISIQNDACRRYPISRTQANLEYLGTVKSKDFPLVGVPSKTLDGGLPQTPWTGSEGALLSL
jgi:hypothetical protein